MWPFKKKPKTKTRTITFTKRTSLELNEDAETYVSTLFNVFIDNYSGHTFVDEDKALKYYEALVQFKGFTGVKVETLKQTTMDVEY